MFTDKLQCTINYSPFSDSPVNVPPMQRPLLISVSFWWKGRLCLLYTELKLKLSNFVLAHFFILFEALQLLLPLYMSRCCFGNYQFHNQRLETGQMHLMANESCSPLKFSVWADKKDPVYGQGICSIILLHPLLEKNDKTRNSQKQRSTRYKISAVTIYFHFPSLCKSCRRIRWQRGLIGAGFTSHKPLTRFLVQRYYKCLEAYSVPQQGWLTSSIGHSYPVSTDTGIYNFYQSYWKVHLYFHTLVQGIAF